MSEPELPASAGKFPDDGIPVLTEVVDAALLPAIDPATLDATDDDDPAGPPSLAMFPELETDSGYLPPPESPPPGLVASFIEPFPAPLNAVQVEPQQPDPPPAAPPDGSAGVAFQAAHELPLEASNAARYEAPAETVVEPHNAPEIDSHTAAEALPEPLSPIAPKHEISYAERYAARYAALHQLPPVVPVTPAVEQAHTWPAPAEPAAQGMPAAVDTVPETPSEIETRIFESIAARLDRLLDQRLEAIVPGVVEAALYGIQAGMTASVKQALREAVELAVRNEFERKREP